MAVQPIADYLATQRQRQADCRAAGHWRYTHQVDRDEACIWLRCADCGATLGHGWIQWTQHPGIEAPV